MVLPDGQRTDIAFEFLKEQPDLPVILMTGYTDERADWERVREAGLVLLQKLFLMAIFLTQVQDALKNQEGAITYSGTLWAAIGVESTVDVGPTFRGRFPKRGSLSEVFSC